MECGRNRMKNITFSKINTGEDFMYYWGEFQSIMISTNLPLSRETLNDNGNIMTILRED